MNFLLWSYGVGIDIGMIISRYFKVMPYYMIIHGILQFIIGATTIILEWMGAM